LHILRFGKIENLFLQELVQPVQQQPPGNHFGIKLVFVDLIKQFAAGGVTDLEGTGMFVRIGHFRGQVVGTLMANVTDLKTGLFLGMLSKEIGEDFLGDRRP